MAMASSGQSALPRHQPVQSCSIERPSSFQDWQISLKQVQALYGQQQYKKCFALCGQLLNFEEKAHPVHVSALFFYSALSSELHANSLPDIAAKIPHLELAGSHYISAKEVLPEAIPWSPWLSPTHSRRQPRPYPEIVPEPDSPPPVPTWAPRKGRVSKGTFRPPELTSPRSGRGCGASVISSAQLQECQTSRRIGSQTLSVKHSTIRTGTSNASLNSPTGRWVPALSNSQFDRHLRDFGRMLEVHIRDVTERIEAAKDESTGTDEVQGSGGVKSAELGRLERIQSLKERGYYRARFDPMRYQHLCWLAEAELESS